MRVNNTVSQHRVVLAEDREKFKELLLKRLTDCGWRDQVLDLVQDFIKKNKGSMITLDMLINDITPLARALVPSAIKKEMLKEIKAHLSLQKKQ